MSNIAKLVFYALSSSDPAAHALFMELIKTHTDPRVKALQELLTEGARQHLAERVFA